MMNIVTSIENLLGAINDFKNQMLEKANAERHELIDLSARMADTYETMTSLSQVCKDTGDSLIATGRTILPIATAIGDVLDGEIPVPSIPYEKYAGVCADCGEDVSNDTDYSYNEDHELLCADCADIYYGRNIVEEKPETPVIEEQV